MSEPKIGYLVDTNAGWSEDPEWKFYREEDLPRYERKPKRIVYWEVSESE